MTDVQRSQWLLGGISFALTLLIAGAVYMLSTRSPGSTTVEILPPPPSVTPLPTATPAPLEVYVVGAVVQPESRHQLPPGSRVEDAIQSAGGPLTEADLAAVNLAQPLRDGDMIVVPIRVSDEPPTADTLTTPTPNTPRLVNINTASQTELETLPGIGPSRAQDIIAYREANGPFTSVDDLDNVPGIGPATLEELRPLVTLED